MLYHYIIMTRLTPLHLKIHSIRTHLQKFHHETTFLIGHNSVGSKGDGDYVEVDFFCVENRRRHNINHFSQIRCLSASSESYVNHIFDSPIIHYRLSFQNFTFQPKVCIIAPSANYAITIPCGTVILCFSK